MIANEFLLITNENGLRKEAARIGLNWSRSERVTANPSGAVLDQPSPIPAKPRPNIAQVDSSGTAADVVTVPPTPSNGTFTVPVIKA